MSQLRLAIRADDALRPELLRVLGEVVAAIGNKQVANELRISPGQLANALVGRNNNRFNVEWLPTLIRLDKTEALIRFLANHARFDLVAQSEPTDDEVDACVPEVAREELGQTYARIREKARDRAIEHARERARDASRR